MLGSPSLWTISGATDTCSASERERIRRFIRKKKKKYKTNSQVRGLVLFRNRRHIHDWCFKRSPNLGIRICNFHSWNKKKTGLKWLQDTTNPKIKIAINPSVGSQQYRGSAYPGRTLLGTLPIFDGTPPATPLQHSSLHLGLEECHLQTKMATFEQRRSRHHPQNLLQQTSCLWVNKKKTVWQFFQLHWLIYAPHEKQGREGT